MDHQAPQREFELSASTSPIHPGQLQELSNLLNQGLKNVEVGTVETSKFDVPRQHLEGIRQLSKLAGSRISVHGPINGVDLAGFPGQGEGQQWSQEIRKKAEEHVISILDKARLLSDNGGVPVVFHAGNLPVRDFDKEMGVDLKTGLPAQRSKIAVNQDTGQITNFEYERKKSIRGESSAQLKAYLEDMRKEKKWTEQEVQKEKEKILKEGLEFTPEGKLHSLNQNQWDDEKLKLLEYVRHMNELRERMEAKKRQVEAIQKTPLQHDPHAKELLQKSLEDIKYYDNHIGQLHDKLQHSYSDLYDKFEKYAKKEDKEKFTNYLKKTWGQKNGKSSVSNLPELFEKTQSEILSYAQEIERKNKELIKKYGKEEKIPITELLTLQKQGEKVNEYYYDQSQIITSALAKMEAPDLWRMADQFAVENVARTSANAMFTSWKKYGDKSPLLVLENYSPDRAVSTAKELRQCIKDARQQLATKLVDEGKLKEEEAKKTAEKLIAATWDLGHVSMMRKSGMSEEEIQKFAIQQTKEVADVVRHVHINDTFGFFDSHMPPGMGIVPTKEMMKELEAVWAKQGLDQKPLAVVEAGAFVGNFKVSPHLDILSYFDQPLFESGATPYWHPEHRGGMMGAYGMYRDTFIEFPQQHFNLYGSSFSTLPKTLGGQVGGEGSRFSGTPNQ